MVVCYLHCIPQDGKEEEGNGEEDVKRYREEHVQRWKIVRARSVTTFIRTNLITTVAIQYTRTCSSAVYMHACHNSPRAPVLVPLQSCSQTDTLRRKSYSLGLPHLLHTLHTM